MLSYLWAISIRVWLKKKKFKNIHKQQFLSINLYPNYIGFVNYIDGCRQTWSYHKTDNLNRDDCNLNSQCYNKQHKMSETIAQNA